MDDTHLRFFTYYTAKTYLLSSSTRLKVLNIEVTGSVPLWILRRYVLSRSISKRIDKLGLLLFPNLFGNQIIIKLQRN